MANSKDPDEMLHNAAFHQGLHCLLFKIKLIFRERIVLFLEIVTYNPIIYTIDHPDFIVCSFKENSIGLKT